MPPNLTAGTTDWLGEELIQAKILESRMVSQLSILFRRDFPFGDADAFGDHLVTLGLLTRYQAKRSVEGDAKKLVIGPYLLMEPLGQGGMGAVFRAMGRADRRNYVVKLLPLRNQWNVRLARRQVEIFEKLPPQEGVVPFVDVGTANGQHYLVWPYVEGQTLEKQVRDKGPFAAKEIARLGIQLAEALNVCHPRAIVHGFLKPTNVMLGYDGQARLLDFGVGVILAENSDQLDSMIDTCATAQTTASMLECAAPEIAIDPSHLTPQSDQYSLGCVLYFAATGRYPFPDGTAMDKVYSHQKRKPIPIAQLAPELPGELIAAIDRLMSKAPQDRYRKLRDLVDQLAPFSWGGSTSLIPPTVPVDVQTPLPAKVFRKRDLQAEKVDPQPRKEVPMLEAEILGEEENPTAPQQKKRGWLSRWFGS